MPFRLHDIIIIYELLLPLQHAIIDRSNPTRTPRGRELEEIAHPRKSCRSLDLSGLVHSYFVTRLFPGSSAWSATHHNKVWPSALDPQPRPRPPRVGVGVEVEISLSEAPPLRLPLRRRHRLLPPPGGGFSFGGAAIPAQAAPAAAAPIGVGGGFSFGGTAAPSSAAAAAPVPPATAGGFSFGTAAAPAPSAAAGAGSSQQAMQPEKPKATVAIPPYSASFHNLTLQERVREALHRVSDAQATSSYRTGGGHARTADLDVQELVHLLRTDAAAAGEGGVRRGSSGASPR